MRLACNVITYYYWTLYLLRSITYVIVCTVFSRTHCLCGRVCIVYNNIYYIVLNILYFYLRGPSEILEVSGPQLLNRKFKSNGSLAILLLLHYSYYILPYCYAGRNDDFNLSRTHISNNNIHLDVL